VAISSSTTAETRHNLRLNITWAIAKLSTQIGLFLALKISLSWIHSKLKIPCMYVWFLKLNFYLNYVIRDTRISWLKMFNRQPLTSALQRHAGDGWCEMTMSSSLQLNQDRMKNDSRTLTRTHTNKNWRLYGRRNGSSLLNSITLLSNKVTSRLASTLSLTPGVSWWARPTSGQLIRAQ